MKTEAANQHHLRQPGQWLLSKPNADSSIDSFSSSQNSSVCLVVEEISVLSISTETCVRLAELGLAQKDYIDCEYILWRFAANGKQSLCART